MIVIIDYEVGNVSSIKNMLKKAGYDSMISRDDGDIAKAEKLILPGVGSFDHGMSMLKKFGLVETLNSKVIESKAPILGICLGMQLLLESSQEGQEKGLGWIKGEVKRFDFGENRQKLKVPHMGWNHVESRRDNLLFQGFEQTPRFYFVHSYYVSCEEENNSIGTTCYGFDFTSAVCNSNVFGTQFHPEKSHKYGLQLLKNFAAM